MFQVIYFHVQHKMENDNIKTKQKSKQATRKGQEVSASLADAYQLPRDNQRDREHQTEIKK